jgi:hypothetical protein
MLSRLSSQRLAQIGIGVQFLALIRTLAEYFRLQYVYGPELQLTTVAPFVTGGLLAAVFTAVAVFCYFIGKYSLVVWVAAITIVALLAYKVIALS